MGAHPNAKFGDKEYQFTMLETLVHSASDIEV